MTHSSTQVRLCIFTDVWILVIKGSLHAKIPYQLLMIEEVKLYLINWNLKKSNLWFYLKILFWLYLKQEIVFHYLALNLCFNGLKTQVKKIEQECSYCTCMSFMARIVYSFIFFLYLILFTTWESLLKTLNVCFVFETWCMRLLWEISNDLKSFSLDILHLLHILRSVEKDWNLCF